MDQNPFRLPGLELALICAGAAAGLYFLSKSSPSAQLQMMALLNKSFEKGLRRPQHPEAGEPHRTLLDPHQLGRSELIREIAQPKSN